MKLSSSFLTGAAILLIGTFSSNAADKNGSAGAKGSLNKHDREFILTAAANGMAEVSTSELAKKKAESKGARQFAEMMIHDHTKANDELKMIAKNKGIDVPDMVPKAANDHFHQLEGLSGHEFDAMYLRDMTADHKKVIAMFEEASRKVEDPDLKAYIQKTLPILKTHEQEVMNMHAAK